MTTVIDENVALELGLPVEREDNGVDKKTGIESFKEELKVIITFLLFFFVFKFEGIFYIKNCICFG